MLSIQEIFEVIKFATQRGQIESKISNQYDRYIEHVVKLLAFHKNDSTNKWLITICNIFVLVNRQKYKNGKKIKCKDSFKWLLIDFLPDEKIIRNEIDSSIDLFKYKDIHRNSRSEKEILNLLFSITKKILLKIEYDKFTYINCKQLLQKYII